VLANRYDGIDLAGNACRLLVMDGLPQGTSDYDLYRVNVIADSAVNSLMAQRIEQGIGRGTRGGGDFCAVVLIGSKLVGWLGRKNNLDHLTSSTRIQLKMGQEVSESVKKVSEISQTIMKCLTRDSGWVTYHASELAEAAQATPVNALALRVAGIERRAYRQQRLGQYEAALQTLENLVEESAIADDANRRAWLLALAARIAYQMGDEPRGQKLQTSAFTINSNHTPPKIRPPYIARPVPGRQSAAIVDRLLSYERRGALIADFSEDIGLVKPTGSGPRP
jgi:replicative superfamily II helicase